MLRYLSWAGLGLALIGSACTGAPGDDEDVGQAEAAECRGNSVEAGKKFFDTAPANGNGRACATCHVEANNTTLLPSDVQARLAANPNDELFKDIDADNPSATPLTFERLKLGLIRVVITLADNLDVIDANGNVVTNADRTIEVFRGVPTAANTALDEPYQLDGRAATLQIQAAGAFAAHAQVPGTVPESTLDDIAAFEEQLFTSPGVAAVAKALKDGKTPPDPDPHFAPHSPEGRGKALFQQVCAGCHGGARGEQILDPELVEELHPKIKHDGTVAVHTRSDGVVLPNHLSTTVPHEDRFPNIGISFGTVLGQLGKFPSFTSGVSFPQYRFRLYRDGSRTKQVVDLPPPPSEIGPDLAVEPFTTDPGRMAISGNYNDYEGFDIPQLRGIVNTPPYFHDNSANDLETVIEIYSALILPQIPKLHRHRVYPPATSGPFSGFPPGSLSPDEKADLLAYLKKI